MNKTPPAAPTRGPGRPPGILAEGSIADHLVKLKLNDSISRSEAIPMKKATMKLISERMEAMCNLFRKPVERAAEVCDHEFEIYRGHFTTRADSIIVVGTIVRTK